MFSARTRWDRSPNPFAAAVARARSSGKPLFDLTESNPTRCALLDLTPLVAELGNPRGTSYEPEAFGHLAARSAIARSFGAPSKERTADTPAGGGAAIDPGHIVLSASTSEAYGWLFKLLTDPGDQILVPRPSYPLLAWLAAAEGVELVSYPLVRDAGYCIDFGHLEASIGPKSRAIVVVHPNNPTGHFVRRDDAERLVALAASRSLALIVDEVFADTAHRALPADRLASFVGTTSALTFVMSGASKVLLLPQCKIAWTIVSGPDPLVTEALGRLELVADSYLSVSTPVQLALPALLQHRGAIAAAVRHRVTRNLAELDRVIALRGPTFAVRRLPVEGGWYATLEIPAVHDDDGWSTLLVEREGVLVQPGYFFDFDRDGFLVVSLLPEPGIFDEAVERLIRGLARELDR